MNDQNQIMSQLQEYFFYKVYRSRKIFKVQFQINHILQTQVVIEKHRLCHVDCVAKVTRIEIFDTRILHL
jgi:hypothetical protein